MRKKLKGYEKDNKKLKKERDSFTHTEKSNLDLYKQECARLESENLQLSERMTELDKQNYELES